MQVDKAFREISEQWNKNIHSLSMSMLFNAILFVVSSWQNLWHYSQKTDYVMTINIKTISVYLMWIIIYFVVCFSFQETFTKILHWNNKTKEYFWAPIHNGKVWMLQLLVFYCTVMQTFWIPFQFPILLNVITVNVSKTRISPTTKRRYCFRFLKNWILCVASPLQGNVKDS